MVFSPSFDQKVVGVKWAGGHDVIVFSMSYTASASSPSLTVEINGVGTFSVSDDKVKIGGLGAGSVPIVEGPVTPEMWKTLYAWSYSAIATSGTSVPEGYAEVGFRNVIVLNWSLIKKALGLNTPNFTAIASASPNAIEHPPVFSYDVWENGYQVEVIGAPKLNVRSDSGVEDVYENTGYVGPNYPSFSNKDDAIAYISGSGGVLVFVWPFDPGPSIITYDGYMFAFSVLTMVKATEVRVVRDGDSYSINYSAPDFNGFSGGFLESNRAQEDESVAFWTITGHINADLRDGTMTIDPDGEEGGEEGGGEGGGG